MGARGPLKLPKTALRVVTDEDTAGTAASNVPKVAPVKPDVVTANARLSALWDQIVPELDRTGLVSPADGPAIELALRHFLIARVAADEIDDAVTVEDREGDTRKHPAEAVFRAESEMFLKYAAQLGMTFVSRARTPAAKGDEDGESNPFQATVGAP